MTLPRLNKAQFIRILEKLKKTLCRSRTPLTFGVLHLPIVYIFPISRSRIRETGFSRYASPHMAVTNQEKADPSNPIMAEPRQRGLVARTLTPPLVFVIFLAVLSITFRWPRRWIVSGAPLLQFLFLLGKKRGIAYSHSYTYGLSLAPCIYYTPYPLHHCSYTGYSQGYVIRVFLWFASSNLQRLEISSARA